MFQSRSSGDRESKMCNDSSVNVTRSSSMRGPISSIRQFCRRRSFSRARREMSCSDEEAAKRHSLCSNDSLDSGIDVSPPLTVRSRGSPQRSSLRAPGGAKKTASISFHPQVLVWTAVQSGDFDELFDVLVENVSSPKSRSVESESSNAKHTERPSVDLNRTNHQGITLLHLCCFAGSAKCVRLLLALGANPTRYDDDGWTPLHAASVGGHDEIIQMLVSAGAEITAVDVFGRRPADVAGNDVTKALLRFLAARKSESARLKSMVMASARDSAAAEKAKKRSTEV